MKHLTFSGILVIASLLALNGCSKPTSSPSTNSDPAAPAAPVAGVTSLPAPTPVSLPVVVSAGTVIVVTADQTVSSKTSNPGDHFNASLAAPIRINGEEVIPSGARAVGTVVEAKSAGKFKGHAEITVALSSITVQGQHYSVRTSSVTEAGKGRGKRTGIGAGGGAVVGGIIGALAGGGKGAAIGAGAGAGAGTAGAAFTGNRDIEINAETRLRFRLREPLEITGR
jgi:hypothetical protein